MSEATIPIKELMEKTEQWLLGQGYKKSTLGFYRATWNRFLSYSASPAYSRETAEQFLLQYFGVDVHAIDQTLDGRMRHARRHMNALDEIFRTGTVCRHATKVDRSAAYMARFIAKNIVAAGFAQRCQVTLAYAIGEKEPVMVDVNTFGTGGPCEDDCLSAAVRKAYDLTPAGIIKQLNLLNPIYSRTAAGGHFGREDFPWENIEHMSDLAAYIV